MILYRSAPPDRPPDADPLTRTVVCSLYDAGEDRKTQMKPAHTH